MGQKNRKGTVSVSNVSGRIRLRWRYQGIRYSLSVGTYTKANIALIKKTILKIELDMLSGEFDYSLAKYSGRKVKPQEQRLSSIVEYFEAWVLNYKQMDCNKNSDYYNTRNMLKRWGELATSDLLEKLNKESFGAKTYNERLSILNGFSEWMQKQGLWKSSPFVGVSKRKIKKSEKPERMPFSVEEMRLILQAIKDDSYCPKSSRYRHSFYYPFVYFLFKTGVRNAEAVGLRVSSLDFNKSTICIKEALARTVKGAHSSARVRKDTKNGKVRILPFTDDLKEVLKPLIVGKSEDDLVFQSYSGLPIDDKMFQRRVFSVILKALNLPHRVLYACRHTFGSRCIELGITPVMTAFLMGNNPETALRNYTHQISIPNNLPDL